MTFYSKTILMLLLLLSTMTNAQPLKITRVELKNLEIEVEWQGEVNGADLYRVTSRLKLTDAEVSRLAVDRRIKVPKTLKKLNDREGLKTGHFYYYYFKRNKIVSNIASTYITVVVQAAPIIESIEQEADGKPIFRIGGTLPEGATYEFERKASDRDKSLNGATFFDNNFEIVTLEILSGGLLTDKTADSQVRDYQYRVRILDKDGKPISEWSKPKEVRVEK